MICDYATLAARASRLAGAFQSSGLRAASASRWSRAMCRRTSKRCSAAGGRDSSRCRSTPSSIRRSSPTCWRTAARAGRSSTRRGVRPSAERGDDAGTLARVVELGGAEYAGLLGGSPSAAPAPCAAADPAWLFYTSGTTGRPKGVVISHGNLRAMSRCFLACVEAVAPGDALLHPAPLSHGSGLYVLPHVAAGAVNVVPESGGFDPDEICRLLGAWDRACFFAAPTMVKRLVTAPALGDAQARPAEEHRLWRRADVRRRRQVRVRRARAAARADLRPGRVADDDHRDEPRARCRCGRARRRRAARLGGHCPDGDGGARRRRGRPCACLPAKSARCSCAGRR